MSRFVGYIAMSLDGCIADADGGIGWLSDFAVEGEDNGYAAFYETIDALIMGRSTYDVVAGFGDWPYPGKPSAVLTSRPVATERGDVFAAASPADAVARLKDARRVWVMGGGATQRAMLDAGFFDEIRVFVVPVILGGGPPLFTDGRRNKLRRTHTKEWPGGLVELAYEIEEGT